MKPTGLPRRIDHLGRIVIPVELRRLLGIAEGDYVGFSSDGDRIVLEKVEERCTFCGTPSELRPYKGKLVCDACASDLSRT